METPVLKLGQGDFTRTWPPKQLITEPSEVYHAKAVDYLSSHRLADFRKCPLLFRRKQLGLIPPFDSAAYALGRAAHVLILEGRKRFEAEFAVGGPINPKTGEPFGTRTKAYAEWAETIGKPVLSDCDAAIVEEMSASVRRHIFAHELLSEGVPEAVVRTDYQGTACQARLDWLNPIDERGIVDLKTCKDLDQFEEDFKSYGYAHQMAFYREVLFASTGTELPVHIIAVEKKEPFRCGVWKVSNGSLYIAAQDNIKAIKDLKRCQELGSWPTGYESLRMIA